MNFHGMMASAAWGLFMAAVIAPGLDLTQTENILGTIAGALMITAIFSVSRN
jgi:arginine repressor